MATVFNRVGGGSGGEYPSVLFTSDGFTSSGSVAMTGQGRAYSGAWVSKQISVFKYLKWNITKKKSGARSSLQLSEFKLIDSNDNVFDWQNSTITSNMTGASSAESVGYIIDGSVDTKYCTTEWSATQTGSCVITITLDRAIDLSVYNRYQYYTADDIEERDPISWTLYASVDGESWITVDTRSDLTITSGRKALAGTWAMDNTSKITQGFLVNNIKSFGTYAYTATQGSQYKTGSIIIDVATDYSVDVSFDT